MLKDIEVDPVIDQGRYGVFREVALSRTEIDSSFVR